MLLVRINCPDPDTARAIARAAVEGRLAACTNIAPPVESVYRCKGAIETGLETPLFLKTREGLFEALADLVTRLHTDETPAILALPVERTTEAFAAWLETETIEP